MCGKYHDLLLSHEHVIGSPPRVREIRNCCVYARPRAGITPACAGNTSNGLATAFRRQDHPRVCGKYKNSGCTYAARLGSPPRVREIRQDSQDSSSRIRITPACAGNTCQPKRFILHTEDHPRVCGKYDFYSHAITGVSGSPPRVREIHMSLNIIIFYLGITPACAGNTVKNSLYYAITLTFDCIFHSLYLYNILGRLVILLIRTRIIFASSSAL